MTRGAKKMDDFKFNLKGETILVPVWLVKVQSDFEDQRKVYFKAKFDKAGFEETDTDINKLRETMLKKIKEWYTIEWSLYVMVRAQAKRTNEWHEVEFGYDFYALGKRPDGTEVFQEVPEPWGGCEMHESWLDEAGFWNGKWKKEYTYGREPSVGRPKEGRDESGWDKDVMKALLPATRETVNTILAFEMRLKAFGEEMMRRFSPAYVRGTLERIQGALDFPLALPAKKEGEHGRGR